jgi:nucleoside-diphosphate-sugar epimerase
LPALAQQIQRINERQLKARVFPGNSRHGQAAVHLDDLLDLLRRVIERRDELPQAAVFMVGEPDVPSYDALQRELVRLIHGETWELQEIPKTLAKSGAWVQEVVLPKEKEPFIKHWMIDIADAHYELDIGETVRALGWQPEHRLLATLPGIVTALKRDPSGWYRQHQLETGASEKGKEQAEERPGRRQ